ncbi:hypothetical protein F4825DRAFT_429960 [Nemania diffusa]|nr:hypothetical protein F4825DRAFT_429960 [Nemania diffusa]
MAHAPRRLPVEIPLSSKPRDYRPGDGPALAPVRPSLTNDTGAFIIDKRVLPGEPVHGELKLELYYIVGWPDLPAARVAILATKILDYVSPWALEDWEYKSSLEKDREQERKEATQKRKRDERAQARIADTPVTGTSTPGTSGQAKRGRPSKAEVRARRIAQQASFGEDELANVPLPPASTNGPSLSTPKKRLARVAMDIQDLEETDTNEAIAKQLQGGSESESDYQAATNEEEAPNMFGKFSTGTGAGFRSLDSSLPGTSSRGYAELFIPNLPYSIQHDPTRSTSPSPIFLPPNSKSNPSRRKTQLTNPVPVPSSPRRTWNQSETPIPAPSYPLPKAKLPAQPHVVTVTPIPVPSHPTPKPKPKEVPHEAKVTPIPPPLYPVPPPKEPHTITYTPIPPPLPIIPNRSSRLAERDGLTTPGRSDRKLAGSASAKSKHTNMSRTPSKRKQPQPEVETEWEVKRLEGDKVVEIEGKRVRYFLVRWVGKWPAGQNPTWEPEEHISEAIVRRYLKNKLVKIAQSGSPSTQMENPTPTFKRTYSSVAEAFEGDDGVHALLWPSSNLAGGLHMGNDDDDDDDEDHLQVTEQPRANSSLPKPRIDPKLVRELAASFS